MAVVFLALFFWLFGFGIAGYVTRFRITGQSVIVWGKPFTGWRAVCAGIFVFVIAPILVTILFAVLFIVARVRDGFAD